MWCGLSSGRRRRSRRRKGLSRKSSDVEVKGLLCKEYLFSGKSVLLGFPA
jgi:hypothetical protein